MNTLSTYDFNSDDVRVTELDGEPWFLAIDVCKVLGLSNVSEATSNISNTEVQTFRVPGTRGRANKIVNESGLYQLVFQSRKPHARDFRDWVTGTVLPAIRKDGGYVMGEEKVTTGEMSEDELVLKAISVMQKKIERLAAENEAMTEELHKVTIAEYTALNHVYFSQSEKGKLATKASHLAAYRGITLDKQERVVRARGKIIHTAVKVYPRELLDEVAADLNLFAEARGEN